ncbi:methyltransferase domain-containing protein [Candidatus Acetothermia bacterium]|nr:methyltransferase domain-containing protein [Candidatus Acetothermia bacterium]
MSLSFPERLFDSVFEFYVLHHIQDYGKAIKEVQRILKPGGNFYATDISQRFFKLPVIGSLFPHEALVI